MNCSKVGQLDSLLIDILYDECLDKGTKGTV